MTAIQQQTLLSSTEKHTTGWLSIEVHTATARLLVLAVVDNSGRGHHVTGLTAGAMVVDPS